MRAECPLARNEAPKGLWQSVFPPKTKTRPRETVAFWRGRFAEILRISALALISAISAKKDERTDSHDQSADWSRNDGGFQHFATRPFLPFRWNKRQLNPSKPESVWARYSASSGMQSGREGDARPLELTSALCLTAHAQPVFSGDAREISVTSGR